VIGATGIDYTLYPTAARRTGRPTSAALFSQLTELHRSIRRFFQSSAGRERRGLSSFIDVFSPSSTPSPTCRQYRKSDAVNANLSEKAHGERYWDGGFCGKLYNRWRVERAKNLLGEGKLSIGLNLPAAVS
jgi:hypothetical protein